MANTRQMMATLVSNHLTIRLEPRDRDRELMDNITAASQEAMRLENSIKTVMDNAECFSPETLKAMQKDMETSAKKLNSHKDFIQKAPKSIMENIKEKLKAFRRYLSELMPKFRFWLEELVESIGEIITMLRQLIEWIAGIVETLLCILGAVLCVVAFGYATYSLAKLMY